MKKYVCMFFDARKKFKSFSIVFRAEARCYTSISVFLETNFPHGQDIHSFTSILSRPPYGFITQSIICTGTVTGTELIKKA